jgi:hypothetical protein
MGSMLSDSPTSTAIVTTGKEAKALARSLFGEHPTRMRYVCIACGWDKTLEFEESEIAALGGDMAEYSGPCGACKCMTLVPHGSILAGTNIEEMAGKNFTKQVEDASDIVLDKLESRVVNLMTGGAGAAVAPTVAPAADDAEEEK